MVLRRCLCDLPQMILPLLDLFPNSGRCKRKTLRVGFNLICLTSAWLGQHFLALKELVTLKFCSQNPLGCHCWFSAVTCVMKLFTPDPVSRLFCILKRCKRFHLCAEGAVLSLWLLPLFLRCWKESSCLCSVLFTQPGRQSIALEVNVVLICTSASTPWWQCAENKLQKLFLTAAFQSSSANCRSSAVRSVSLNSLSSVNCFQTVYIKEPSNQKSFDSLPRNCSWGGGSTLGITCVSLCNVYIPPVLSVRLCFYCQRGELKDFLPPGTLFVLCSALLETS